MSKFNSLGVILITFLSISFLTSSSAFLGHMSYSRRFRAFFLRAGKGFGSRKDLTDGFPSIDAFAKDKEILIRDKGNQAVTIPSLEEIQNSGKGQFGRDREEVRFQ